MDIAYVLINALLSFETLLAVRAIILFIRTEVPLTHVSFNATYVHYTYQTNHTDKAIVMCLNLALHQVIQRLTLKI